MTGNARKLSGNEVRERFLQFFESKGHRRVRSSSLVPHGDPTLLFTNAGMNQFKDVFLGLEKRDYNRATTAQKCVRAGGKHNDLENVGFTKRHHTFFEMLGNFSFGDYFKREAIAYAWELVTSPEWFAIPVEKLYFTVFGGPEGRITDTRAQLAADHEAAHCWASVGAQRNRIFEIPGFKDNFWAMGDTGPCGPCSEIFYDMGPAASEEGHADCKFPCDCGRYVEIWNLVFMQFNRYCELEGFSEGTEEVTLKLNTVGPVDPSHKHGPECLRLRPLPKPSVDTGMGLERVAAVLQGVTSNYGTDLFQPLIQRTAQLAKIKYGDDFKGDSSLRVIADHSRAATFLITDGVVPGRDRREYVLRKILRRAIRHGKLLGIEEPFIHLLVAVVVAEMGEAYPELVEAASTVSLVILQEEKLFGRTLSIGWKKMEEAFGRLIGPHSLDVKELEMNPPNDAVRDIARQPHTGQLSGLRRMTAILSAAGKPLAFPGEEAFKLSDTFGVPRDFIEDSCRDMGLVFDTEGYEKALAEQRTRSRVSWKGGSKEAAAPVYAKLAETLRTEPDFYSATAAKDCRIEGIVKANALSSNLFAGESGEVVLDRTVIYAESGGQMADTGAFYDPAGTAKVADVTGAYYPVAGLVAHRITAKDTLRVGDRVNVVADAERRARIMRNHSGTHLVHAALRNTLGTHVKQAGSLNAPERLRFDFTHFAPVDAEELRDIEQQVNDEIRLNTAVETGIMPLDEALNSGALAFFGDKYPESNVRVVTMPDPRSPRGFYSKELCGGTHVHRIGDIGVLKLVGEESVAAGVRRIEAVTGIGALEHYQHQAQVLREVAGRLNVAEDSVLATVEKLAHTVKQLEKELGEQKRKGALNQLDDLLAHAQTVKGVKVVAGEVANVDREGLRQLVDSLRQKLGSGVVALGTPEDGKVALIAGVTKDLTTKVHAGKLIQALAKQVGGSGGGRPDLAEAGGKDTSALKSALASVPSLLEPLL